MEIQIPYNWLPEPHQLPVLQHPARFKVIIWHRKAHKTTLAINELIRWSAAVKGTYWYVAPFYNQAKKIVWQDPEMLAKYVPPEIWKKRNNSELYIPFPNGSILYVMGADKPESLRGPNPRGVVLDECKDIKLQTIWGKVIQPIMFANPKAWTWFMGTIESQDEFWNKYNYAKDSGDPSWAAFLLKASESGIITKESLEEAKRTTTQAFFNAEYECEPGTNAAAFFRRVKENTWNGELEPEPNHFYKLGVDLAKYQDWTVITPFDLSTFRAGKQDRFNQVDWNLQKARVEATAFRFNRATITVDSTGVGDPIAEDLKARLTLDPEDGFKFTEVSRRQLLDNLALLLEQDKIKIPDDEGLIAELQSMRFVLKTTEGGKSKIHVEVPEGMSDDRIMSLALAVWNVTTPIDPTDTNYGLYATRYN